MIRLQSEETWCATNVTRLLLGHALAGHTEFTVYFEGMPESVAQYIEELFTNNGYKVVTSDLDGVTYFTINWEDDYETLH